LKLVYDLKNSPIEFRHIKAMEKSPIPIVIPGIPE
jgi:hypothetical protein